MGESGKTGWARATTAATLDPVEKSGSWSPTQGPAGPPHPPQSLTEEKFPLTVIPCVAISLLLGTFIFLFLTERVR